LEKIVPIVVPPARKKVHFTFPECVRSGRVVIELSSARKVYGENVVFRALNLHVERGERIAIVGQNGAGKSTLMRMLSGVEAPDAGTRREGHQVIAQYFAQDEADRLDPVLTVYETLAVSSPTEMVPMIRNILGGFLFSGEDVYKRAAVLSGGERTRLAVARMLLRPSNTLLLDEPTNHLDLDSKDVLLGALADFGGTIIFVSHDRYFLDRLATKVVDVGGGEAVLFPGTYEEFHDRKMRGDEPPQPKPSDKAGDSAAPKNAWEEQKRAAAEARKRERAAKALQARVAEIESQIGRREQEIKDLEAAMAQPAFYDHQATARTQIERHEKLIAEVDALMHEWEEVNTELAGID
ncbi:MAG: ABC-F family ATP-binding cassette domain-containing protein, partial [Acidobacteria bacterium]|nr:ABC-F family ATP-binding cassette domain-containing protein [Acidobacteriota bacterium]